MHHTKDKGALRGASQGEVIPAGDGSSYRAPYNSAECPLPVNHGLFAAELEVFLAEAGGAASTIRLDVLLDLVRGHALDAICVSLGPSELLVESRL